MSDQNAQLVAELAGLWTEAPKPQSKETPIEAPALSLEEQLDATKPAVKPAPIAQQMDKTHAIKAGGKGYVVTVEGEYYAKSVETKGHVIKPYTLRFNLPSLTNERKESALGIIVGASRPGGGMLRRALTKMDPLATTYRTHTITKVEALAGEAEPLSLQYMSLEALQKFVAEDQRVEGFPLNPSNYWDVDHLREDIIDFITNKTGDVVAADGTTTKGGFGQKKTPAERIRERHAMRVEEHELMLMNPGL